MLVLCVSCASDPLDVDVSNVAIDIPVERMEQELILELDSVAEARELNAQLLDKYGLLYEIFVREMIKEGSAHDPMVGDYLYRRFKEDQLMKESLPDVQSEFADFQSWEQDIESAFKYYRHYFPDSALPERVVTFYSYFNAPAFVVEDDICLGLEMYLGAEHPSMQKLPPNVFPNYFKERMDKKFLVSNAVKAWLLEKFYRDIGDDLLSQFVAAGKIMYLMDAMMPNTADHLKIGYTEEALAWAQASEEAVWQELVDGKKLYSKDDMIATNWIDDGPFTKGLPKESPSRMGIWMGWQMVRDYMKKNPEVTLLELIEEPNSQRILKHYDPKA